MAEPRAEPAARIVLHGAHFGRHAERVGDTLGGALVVRREAHAHMAVVEDGVVLAVGLLDLVQRLGDEEALQAVAGHEGERALEEVETAERRKLVEHEQQPMPAALRVQFLGEAPADLIEDQADQRLGPADVGRRHDEVERHGMLGLDQIADAPVAACVTAATTGSR